MHNTSTDLKFAQTLQIHYMLYNRTMPKFIRLIFALVISFSLLAVGQGTAYAQDGSTEKYFPETGHRVSGEFWQYYRSFANANLIFGYPLTEAFTDVKSGRVVQYFTRARFELYPQDLLQKVHLTALGSAIYTPGQNVGNFATMGCRSFKSGFPVCFSFLDFFDKNGGEAVFGQPISSFQFSNGRIVQYFERARFDWYPEYGEGQKVVMADLGRIYFDFVKEDANLLQPALPADKSFDVVLGLHTRAFVWKAVTQTNDQQVVYVIVQDQTLRPVPGAKVIMTVYWSKGSPASAELTTNANGVSVLPFVVQNQAYGSLITVDVRVEYGKLKDNAVTSFRIWQ
jgi:hypothetical protein